MEKINQGQKITVEHLDGYSWKNVLISFCIFIFYSFVYVSNLKDDEHYSKFFNIFGGLFLIILTFSLSYYILNPEKIHDKQYTIYFFKDYLLLEKFNKKMENHELPFYYIKRIYTQKKWIYYY